MKNYKISKEVKDQILDRVKNKGVPVSECAKDAGINPRTIYGWLGKGAKGIPTFVEMSKLKKQNKALLELVGAMTLKLSQSKKKN